MIILIILVIVVLAIVSFFSTYTVVGNNQAHVVVFMGGGRKVKTPVSMDGSRGKTSYFYIPFLMKRSIMPLTNVKLDIKDIHLNDIQVAPFVCDVVTWLHIADPVKAAERLNFVSGAFDSLHEDLTAIVQAIARASAMKQEILDIMRDRATFSKGVSSEVDIVLNSWGVQLVNLEINDIRDQANSSVIANYESMRKAGVQSAARIEVSKRDREAVEAEQENRRLAETAKADSEKAFQVKQIERDTVVGIANQSREQKVALAEAETNKTKVNALRVMTVGNAEVQKEAVIAVAQGEGEAIRVKGEKEAAIITLKGTAEGSAIESKGLAEAKAKDAMAEALKKFNEAGISLEKIKAWVEVQKSFAGAYGQIASHAEIKVVTSGKGGNILGLPMNAETGADIGQLIEGLGAEKITEFINNFSSKKETKE
jgi:flotillin